MATKKKVTIEVTTGAGAQDSQPISLSYDAETQKILYHFGENSAEYVEVKSVQNKLSKPQTFVSDEAVEHLIGELSGGAV